MLGLAVGIDYALFVIARHQDQLKEGLDPEEAAARSIATSGSAVVFAAMTVIIALLGLSVAGIPFLTTMGVAAALAVALAVAVSLTLTPALLGFAGWRAVARRYRPNAHGARHTSMITNHETTDAAAGVRGVRDDTGPADRREGRVDGLEGPADGLEGRADRLEGPADGLEGRVDGLEEQGRLEQLAELEDPEHVEGLVDPEEAEIAGEDAAGAQPRRGRFFRGWVRTVTRWPVVTVVLIVGLLWAAALPLAHLRLALPDAGSLDETAPGRITYDLIAEHFGPGFNGPLIVTGSVIQSSDPVGLMNDLGTEIAGVDGVAAVPLSTPNETGDTGIVQVIPTGSPDSEETADLVATLRSMHDQFEAEYGVDLSVTGYTAAGIDISAQLGGALLPFGVLVVGLSLVLLAMVFRSIVVPVTAALGYILSIAAAFGLTTLVFVDGFLAGPLNVADVGSVISFMPIILMGVLFGLAMDYEVFLVSRMREDYVYRRNARGAVEEGFVASARVVTAAATIMLAVFASFIPDGDASIQPIAFGLAVGVVIDAFIVRMGFIPAVLVLFGDRAWWMPGWLERLLPHFDIEGEGLAEELALAEWPGDPDIVIAAEAMRAGDGPELDAMVPRGGALILHGGTPGARTDLLLALGGRFPMSSGRAKVVGLVLPVRASAVRRRTAYLRAIDAAADLTLLTDALERDAGILMIDAVDDVSDPAARAGLAATLAEGVARAERLHQPLTFVVACRESGAAADILPGGAAAHTVPIEAPHPIESAVV
jgi:RND superfamily putative drug exporter